MFLDKANTSTKSGNWITGMLDFFRKSPLAIIATTLALLLIGAGLILTNGDIRVIAAVLLPVALVWLTFYHLEYSFILLVGGVLVFDQHFIPGFTPFTYYVDFFRNFKEISYLPGHPAGVVNPVELYLMMLFGVWVLTLAARKKVLLQSIPVWPAFLLFAGCIAIGFINGLRSGGSVVTAFWEIRALVYFCILYLVVPQIIKTRKQIRILMWVVIASVFFKAFQGIYRFGAMGFTTEAAQAFTNHEDPVFITTLFIFLAAMLLLKYKDRQRTVLLLLAIPLLAGFYFSLRRAAFAGLFISFAALFVLLDKEERTRYLKLAIPGLILVLIYGAAFWDSDSKIAKPVQMIKSGLIRPDKTTDPADYYSNLYRDYENYNLARTVQRKPVMGIGFGNKYDKPIELANIDFPLRDYIPHNQIIWWMVKTGAIGFFAFWLFFNSIVYKGASIYSRLKDPYLKAICAMVVLAVINQMVVSYFDLQLTYYRNMIYLGTLVGLLPTIKRLDDGKPDE